MPNGGDDGSQNPRFFRILMSSDFSKKLPLPRAFTKHLTDERSTTRAALANPKGKSWRVDVVEEDGYLLFGGDTWTHFLRAHRLALGYFLVFTYRGNMAFDFRAFDHSTCEILYPAAHTETQQQPQEPASSTGQKTRTMDEICKQLDVFDPVPETPVFAATKRGRRSKTCKQPEEDRNSGELACSTALKKGRLVETCRQPQYQNPRLPSRSKALTFVSILTEYNVTRPYLYIPIGVMRQCGELKRLKEVTLVDPAGRSWRVTLFHRKMIRKGVFPGTHLATGWPQFVLGNRLRRDDRCFFEFMPKKGEIVMNVEIVRRARRTSK